MFEARLTQGIILKQLVDAIKDLVQDANIDVSENELSIQAMDSSHVSLVAVSLREGMFDHYRCDRPISLGFNSQNLSKILKCAGNDDVITLKAEEEGENLTLMFESPSQDRIADFGEFQTVLGLSVIYWQICVFFPLLPHALHHREQYAILSILYFFIILKSKL
mmetsp:Transcript_14209/g.14380  ORF Transcript_14209/g.14380 Transcript_14209/m.14380 type:complete len:164 (+) Transcript_14209:162-653(+)